MFASKARDKGRNWSLPPLTLVSSAGAIRLLEASSFHAFDRLKNPISVNHCVVMAIEIAKLRDIRHGPLRLLP